MCSVLGDVSTQSSRAAFLLIACGVRYPRQKGARNVKLRRVERPPYDQLLGEIAATSWSAVGRRYGVSDNAVRKWVRQYEREGCGE